LAKGCLAISTPYFGDIDSYATGDVKLFYRPLEHFQIFVFSIVFMLTMATTFTRQWLNMPEFNLPLN